MPTATSWNCLAFIAEHADPHVCERWPPIKVPRVGKLANLLDEAERDRAHAPAHIAELAALGDKLLSGPKGYAALGAFNSDERTRALDMLGFARQLVFATFSESTALAERLPIETRYGAARAQNGAMAEFCSKDARLMGVALLPLDDMPASIAELEQILRLGLKAVWIPHRPCGGRSPGHNELDPIWARLAEAHAEGGRQPLERFTASLTHASESARTRFYSQDFADLFGLAS